MLFPNSPISPIRFPLHETRDRVTKGYRLQAYIESRIDEELEDEHMEEDEFPQVEFLS